MKVRRPVILALKIGGVAIFLLVAAGAGSMTYFHFGNPKNTCASCHEMSGMHAGWSSSAHASVHCRECHGGSLTLDFHALGAHLNRLTKHFAHKSDGAIRLTEAQMLKVNNACKSCHSRTFADWQTSRHSVTYSQIFLNPAHNQVEPLGSDCLRCHGMFYGGNIEDLVTATSTHGPWTLKDVSKSDQAAIPCLACHKIHEPAASSAAQLYVRREQAHFSSTILPATPIWQGDRAVKVSSDPRQRLCVQCHAPSAFRQLGSSDDRTPAGVHEGLSCIDCHQSHSASAKASCGTCHPGSSHCGIDVEKMDTTFRAASSKHNIHFVACGDCHNGQRPARKPTN